MTHRFYLSVVLLISLFSTWTTAELLDEAEEMSPEALDAAFTEADAAREAAGWSDKLIENRAADPLAKMAASADLAIRGTVTGQEVVYAADDTPFTHTTLSINEVLEGSYTGSQITVVQEGGPAKHNPENILMLSHTHYFSLGQEEVLFLELDPDSPYPYRQVVIKNRFGVLDGKVFSETGRGLIYTETDEAPGYTLSWSRDRNPHPRFTEFKIGPHELSKQFRQPDQDGDSPVQSSSRLRSEGRPGYQASVDISTFKHALTRHGG